MPPVSSVRRKRKAKDSSKFKTSLGVSPDKVPENLRLSEDEVMGLYVRDNRAGAKAQRLAYETAVNAVLEAAPEEEKERLSHFLLSVIDVRNYPFEFGDGQLDHPIFFPAGRRHQEYYEKEMRTLKNYIRDERLFKVFTEALDHAMACIWAPVVAKERELHDFKERQRKLSRRRLLSMWKEEKATGFEKRLLESKVFRLQGDHYLVRLGLRDAAVGAEERLAVQRLIRRFLADRLRMKPTRAAVSPYYRAYKEMKTNLRLLPYFIDRLYERSGGALVFLDRDARPLYMAALLMNALRGDGRPVYLVPVTRCMIPASYAAAHMREVGILASLVLGTNIPGPSYCWENEDEKVTNEADPDSGPERIADAVRLPEFDQAGELLFGYLKRLGVLDNPSVTAIDLGTLGTATDFTRDVIRRFSPDTEADSYLFYGGLDRVPSFNREMCPSWNPLPSQYIKIYERLPKGVATVEGFRFRRGAFVPEYQRLSEEQSRWLKGIPGEVYLGVRLMNKAIRNLMTEFAGAR